MIEAKWAELLIRWLWLRDTRQLLLCEHEFNLHPNRRYGDIAPLRQSEIIAITKGRKVRPWKWNVYQCVTGFLQKKKALFLFIVCVRIGGIPILTFSSWGKSPQRRSTYGSKRKQKLPKEKSHAEEFPEWSTPNTLTRRHLKASLWLVQLTTIPQACAVYALKMGRTVLLLKPICLYVLWGLPVGYGGSWRALPLPWGHSAMPQGQAGPIDEQTPSRQTSLCKPACPEIMNH